MRAFDEPEQGENNPITHYFLKKKELKRLHLTLAAFKDNVPMVGKLAHELGDVDMQDEWGNTALMFAVMKDNIESVNMLIEHGADPYKKCAAGKSAISMAQELGFTEIAECMIKYCKRKKHPTAQ